MNNGKRSVLDVTHISSRNGTSFRVTLPRKVVESIGLTPEDNVVVFFLENGKVVLEKLKEI